MKMRILNGNLNYDHMKNEQKKRDKKRERKKNPKLHEHKHTNTHSHFTTRERQKNMIHGLYFFLSK